jgi:hypothetical protein
MADILVGLWSRNTPDDSHGSLSKEARASKLEEAVGNLASKITQAAIPTEQKIRGIFVAPEYYFAAINAGQVLEGKGGTERSISQAEKDFVVTMLEKISNGNQGILIVPGTVAWKKPFARTGESRFKKQKDTGKRTMEQKTITREEKAKDALNKFDALGIKTRPVDMVNIYDLRIVSAFSEKYQTNPDFASRVVRGAYSAVFEDDQTPHNDENDTEVRDTLSKNSSEACWKRIAECVLADPGLRQDFLKSSGLLPLPPHAIRVIPSTGDKRQKIASGVANLMRNTAYVCLNGKVRFKYAKRDDFHEAVGADHNTVFIPGAQVGLATIEGIRFGFEICRDHGYGLLSKARGAQKVQVHIVSSAEVTNEDEQMPVEPGGYFLHASSNIRNTAVYQNRGDRMLELETLPDSNDEVDGDPLLYWRIQLK